MQPLASFASLSEEVGHTLSTAKIFSLNITILGYYGYWYGVGLGDTGNVPCDNCNKRQCDYCGDIAVEY